MRQAYNTARSAHFQRPQISVLSVCLWCYSLGSAMFSDPWFLFLMLIVFFVVVLRWVRLVGKNRTIPFSSFNWLPATNNSGELTARVSLVMRGLALLAVVLLIAGIGSERPPRQATPAPPALVIVLDVSSSMTADDFSPSSRLEEAKKHLKEFVESNRHVEMGLILFAASPQLRLPITPDSAMLAKALERAQPADSDEDGTAIGSGIASAVNRLRGGRWGERRILLITDGMSNRGTLSPLDAARLARLFGIRIDVIGIGTDAVSQFWVPNPEGLQTKVEARIDIDDKTLESLASETGGKYQRVRNSGELLRALSALAPMSHPPKITDAKEQSRRWAMILSLVALCLLVLEFLAAHFVFSVLPE